MDVGFVLGSSPQEDQRVRRNITLETIIPSDAPKSTFEYATNSNANFTKRVTTLGLLDFDACSDITMNQAGVNMACKAFTETIHIFHDPTVQIPLPSSCGLILAIDISPLLAKSSIRVTKTGSSNFCTLFLRHWVPSQCPDR